MKNTDLFSTTKDKSSALGKYNSGNGVVEIDLGKVNGDIIDASKGIAAGRVRSCSKSDAEVLIRDSFGDGFAVALEAITLIG